MIYSRIRRHEERKQRKRLLLAIGGMLAILIFLFVFGLKILVGFSLLVDRIRGNAPVPRSQQELVLPPILDPLPEATNSATLTISGRSDPGTKVIVYIDEEEVQTIPTESDGTFSLTKRLTEGEHTVSSKTKNDKGAVSDLSNVVTVTVRRTKPELTIMTPQDDTRVLGDTNTLIVTGKTASDNAVTVNGRLALVSSDGSFSYTHALSEGENVIHVVATDPAGNETSEDRRVTYTK